MTRWSFALLVFAVVLLGVGCGKGGDEQSTAVDWLKPETIDPLDSAVWDALDAAETYRQMGRAAYDAKDYTKSAQYWMFLACHNKRDEMAFFHLACCYAQLGDADMAARALERAYEAGYSDVEWMREEPELKKLHGTKAFEETVQRLEQIEGGSEAQLGERGYIVGSTLLEYRVLLPEGFDPAKEYPLIIVLHGYGRKPDDYMRFRDQFDSPDFIYAAPRAPHVYEGPVTGYSWSLDVPEDEEPELAERSWELSEEYVANFLEHLKSKYKISEAYLLGHSQGAVLAVSAGIRYHDRFKGVICYAGAIDMASYSAEQIEQAKGLRVFVAHGTEDEAVPIEEGRKVRDELTNAGYAVEYYEFDGGHGINADAIKAIERWLKAQ